VSLLIVVTASLVAVPDKAPKKAPVQKEMKKLEGTWTVASMESRGRKRTAAMIERMNYRMTVKGDTYSWEVRNRKTIGATIKLDTKKNPKTMDLLVTEGTLKGQTMRAIYTLDGDTLKICYGPAGGKRPTAFAAPAGSTEVLMVLKKARS
jgi:uncharacterized protein (TIGR03067 family)